MTYILRENLAQALGIAIRTEQQCNREIGNTGKSAFLAGIEDTLAAINRGEYITVK